MRSPCLAAVPLLMALAAPTHAHRLDEFLQSATVRVTPDRVALYLRLVPGVDVAQGVWDRIDTDHDGVISAAEQQAYARRVLADTALRIDGKPVDLEIVATGFPAQADVRQGIGQISLRLQAPWALATGTHRLRLVLGHHRARSVYLVNTLAPIDPAIRITGQHRSVDQTEYELDFRRDSGQPQAGD